MPQHSVAELTAALVRNSKHTIKGRSGGSDGAVGTAAWKAPQPDGQLVQLSGVVLALSTPWASKYSQTWCCR